MTADTAPGARPAYMPKPKPVQPGNDPAAAESALETSALERSLGIEAPKRWMGWRQCSLVLAALATCMLLFVVARWLAQAPQIDAQWRLGAEGRVVLNSSPLPALQGLQGQAVVGMWAVDGTALEAQALLAQTAPRWQVDDAARARQATTQQRLAAGLAAGPTRVQFAQGTVLDIQASARGYGGLGPQFWILCALALALVLFAAIVQLAQPRTRNLLYVTMALCHAGNLLLAAIETAGGLGLMGDAHGLAFDGRLALDAATAAAAVHAFALHPRRLAQAGTLAACIWGLAASGVLMNYFGLLIPQWAWAQALCLALAGAAWVVADYSHRLEPNPYALVMRRFAAIAACTLALVTAIVAAASQLSSLAPDTVRVIGAAASLAWYLCLASLLLLTPFLARSRLLLREFAMVAAIAAIATSADLLLTAAFALGPLTALALALAIALSIYVGGRRLVGGQFFAGSVPSTERIFELIYRAARDVQARPARYQAVLAQLLRALFDPLEMRRVDRVPGRSRVVGGGSVLVVPMRGDDDAALPAISVLLRFAHRGRRLFTLEDARLADRVVEQLRRAVAYDQAVERGRTEERLRIAQDLHDDIGARLLTMMYQAQSREMEEYIRHTLLDLKTLTRGLAATEHRLSHAAAEWKADLQQRLTIAHVTLDWSVVFDQDLPLTMVQWSGLTRVLRELVSNSLYHGHASRIAVRLLIEGPRLSLSVADDGDGREPLRWAHGLGLGGVRKRIKALGGEVAWRSDEPRGIVCEVQVGAFTSPE